jgi:hypothetical protein
MGRDRTARRCHLDLVSVQIRVSRPVLSTSAVERRGDPGAPAPCHSLPV